MKSHCRNLGELITPVDIRNKEKQYTEVLGISIDKEFIPSVANTIGTDLSKYKIIQKGYFACNPMHVGRDERLPIALYDKDNPAIVSPAYFVFKIKDCSLINSEYLMLWFRRTDFDRECWFHTDASVRGGVTWDDLYRLELPLPAIEVQNAIVAVYRVIEKRIALLSRINTNLEIQAQNIFTSMYIKVDPDVSAEWELGCLSQCVDFINGYAFKSSELLSLPSKDCYHVFKMGNIKRNGGMNHEGTRSWINKSKCLGLQRFVLKKGDVLMAMTDMKDNVVLLGHTALMDENDKYIVNQRVGLLRTNGYKSISSYFLYLLTNNNAYLEELRKHAHIGVQVNLTTEDILNSQIKYANDEYNYKFTKLVKPYFLNMSANDREVKCLKGFRELLIQRLSTL